MVNSESIHFFDLYSDFPGASKSWSYNTLKARAVLNFKGIKYTQSWVSYPDLKQLGASLNIPPNKEGRKYTLPAIVHKSPAISNPTGALMDSFAIAQHLDNAFPSPPLFPSGDASYAIFIAVSKFITRIEPGFRPLVVPRVPDHLDARGAEYFRETRSAALGKPLSGVRPTDRDSLDRLWDIVEKESAPLIAMLKGRNGKQGPFFEGEVPGYVDLFLVAHLVFIGRFDKDLLERIIQLGNGEFGNLYNACLHWVEGQGEDKDWPIPSPV